MSVQIRVARKKQPRIQHRPFTEREKELNKMTRQDMIKQWRLKLNPYKMKGIKEFEKGKSNPFYYMSLYKIQQFIKTLEASGEDLYKEDNDRIMFGIEMIVTFKDLLHVTTSEAVATYILFKHKLEAWIRENKRDFSDEEGAKIAYEAITEFRENWEKAMANLESFWRK